MTEQPSPQNAWVPSGSAPTRLVLLRHGVTDFTVAKRFAGRSDLALAEAGREQARRAALRVRQLGPVSAIVSSPLTRTRQTAEAAASLLGLGVSVEPGFVETDFGDWDGYTFGEAQQRWPDELSAWMANPSVAPPGGESFDDVTARVVRARDALLQAHAGTTVLVVSHVTPIKVLVRLALQAPSDALYRIFLSPASISVIDYYADGPVTVRSVNDDAHLATA